MPKMRLKRGDEVWIDKDKPGATYAARLHAKRKVKGRFLVTVRMKETGERRVYERDDVVFPI